MAHDEDRLHHDTEKLLGQAFALTFLINVKVKDRKKAEDRRVKENMEFHQEVERLRVEVNRSGVALAVKTQEGLALAEEKRTLSNEVEDLKKEMMRKEEDFSKATDPFKEDATQSYIVGFKAALEQATVVHPVDFSEVDLGKIVVDGKLGRILNSNFLWIVFTIYF